MRYLILGVTEARDEHGGALPVAGTRLRALLAALALRAGRPVTVAALVDDVWAGEPPRDAPAALQALVGRLRRTLGRDAVTSAPGGYRLAATPDDIDLHVFERLARQGAVELESGDPEAAARTLRTALALWRGPALADLRERDHGLRPEAHRLAATQQRIEADLRRGAAETLVPELRELTAAHPYDEPLRAQLLRALRAQGRQADALVAYEQARQALADGLGTDPGPELTALHRELLEAPAGPAAPAPEPAPVRAADEAPRGNLRPRLTSFVGREPELRAIRADLTRARLVTLTGPGGSGKTRLAEESAAGQGGAWIVELAPLDDPSAVPGAVLSALGLRETALLRDNTRDAPEDPTTRLVEHLSHRSRHHPFLLVLDNCEHVIDAAAALAETLLGHCPRLRVLATSREPLGVPGESVRPVDPLPPDSAHRLFAERARAVRPDFGLEEDTAQRTRLVAEICRRLDGLPLAIELAAARLRLLTPRQIADRLDDRFRLLTSGSRTVLPRQQTLRAVVDWSWDLLEDEERTLLRQVSVFAGGWDLTAAEAVSRSPDAASLLGALVDKSLVVVAPTDAGEMRYRLLETIHEYALERVAETPAVRSAAARSHTAYFVALAEEADPRLRSGDQLPWIQRLETDLDNIRAALHRTVVTDPAEPDALRLVLGMGWFWWLRNFRPEGMSWADRTAALGEDPEDQDDPRYWPRMYLHILRFFLAVDSRPAGTIGEDDELRALMGRVTRAFVELPPEAAQFPGLLWPMTSYMGREVALDVHEQFDEAVANTRVNGGDWEYGVTLMFRTHMLVDMPGGLEGIDEDLAELRALSRRVGDRWMRAQVASAAAEAGMMRGRYEESRAAYLEALELAREVGAHAECPFLLGRLAELSYRAGDLDAAGKGLDQAEAEAERHNVLDSHPYVYVLRASIALAAGDVCAARRFVDMVRSENVYGSPPPHFAAAVAGLSAHISVFEPAGGPATGLRGLTDALRMAVEAGCAETITAHLAHAAGTTMPRLGLYGAAARVLAASDTWRAHGPRSAVEEGRWRRPRRASARNWAIGGTRPSAPMDVA